MSIAFRQKSSADLTATGTTSITKPTGFASTDILICQFGFGGEPAGDDPLQHHAEVDGIDGHGDGHERRHGQRPTPDRDPVRTKARGGNRDHHP
jgi:hypothetical protein